MNDNLISRVFLLFYLVLMGTSPLVAQLERHTWFFGGPTGNSPGPVKSGIKFDFDTNQPSPYNDVRYPLSLQENNIIISDPSTGKLLFYSDGKTVVDGSHQPMSNGGNLMGSVSSMYGTAVVFDPDFCNRYYLFSVQSQNTPAPRGLFYSIVDMDLSGNGTVADPLGNVAVKNISVTPPGINCTEGLFSLPKFNNTRESWLFVGDSNQNELLIYEITTSGVTFVNSYSLSSLIPDLPSIPLFSVKLDYRPLMDEFGQLVIAPGAKENGAYPIGYFNFNTATGALDPGSYVNIATDTEWIYGTAFSPDYTKLYLSDNFVQSLRQYDFNTGQLTTIVVSPHEIRSGGLALGPDGKMYWAHIYSFSFGAEPVTHLSIIRNPNLPGTDCDLQLNGWEIGGVFEPRLVGALPTFGSFPKPPEALEEMSAFCGSDNGVAIIDPGGLNTPVSIVWENGETVFERHDLAAGIYYATVTEFTGCEYFLEVEIRAQDTLNILADDITPIDPTSCLNPDNGALTVISEELFPNTTYQISYHWNGMPVLPFSLNTNDQGILQIPNLEPGEYSDLVLVVEGTNCQGIIAGPWTINLPLLDSPEGFLVNPACLDEPLVLSTFGIPGAVYQWTGPAGFMSNQQTITVSTAATASMQGYYELKIFQGNCESRIDSVLVEFSGLNLDLGEDAALCEDEWLLEAGDDFLAYLWSDNSTASTLTVSTSGTYVLTATDFNACRFVDTILVELFGDLNVDLGEDLFFCAADTISVALSPGADFSTYQWSNGETLPEIVATAPGVYEVEVVSDAGCEATDFLEIVRLDPLPLDLGPDRSLCDFSDVILRADPGFVAYSWSNGESGINLDVKTAGSYWVSAVDEFGCEETDTIAIDLYPQVTLILQKEAVLDLGDSLLLDVQVFPNGDDLLFFWSPEEGLSCTNCLTPIVRPLYTMEYQVSVRNEYGCTDSTSILLRVNPNRAVFIPTAFSPNNDGLNDQLEIFTDQSVEDILSFRVFDRWGELVFEQSSGRDFWDGNLKGKPMNDGVFVYTMEILFIDGRRELYSGDVLLVR